MNNPSNLGSRQFSGERFSGKIHFLFLAALFCCFCACAQDGYWTGSAGGSWNNAGNWDSANGIAGGADNTAYFGFSREGAIAPNAIFTLDGTQTIGNLFFTTQESGANWVFEPGSNGSLTLANAFGPSEITVTSPNLTVALNAVLGGETEVVKNGGGTLELGGANTYSGQTWVAGGALDVNGSLASGGVEVTNASLSGTGVINGPVVIGAGGTLLLTNSSGPLSIYNSLFLGSGSTTIATISGSSGHALVQGLAGITYGGTLIINNLAGGLSLGQSFSLFGSAPASGNFSQILPPPGPWMRWEFNPTNGQITVVSSASQPHFAHVRIAAGKPAYDLSGGPPGLPCYIQASTNLFTWTLIGTNMFDMSGNCGPTNSGAWNGASQVYLRAFIIPSP